MRALVALLVVAPALAGCLDFLDPGPPVSRTQLESGQTINFRIFQVIVDSDEPVPVRIVATADDGRTLTAEGHSHRDEPVVLELEDGTWDITYHVDGKRRETFRDVRVDAAPPTVTGLERSGAAAGGRYTIGLGVQAPDAAHIRVIDLSGRLLATSLPYTVTGLTGDRIYAYLVAFGDEAGNWSNFTVQVRVGDATALPAEGALTFGVLARYTSESRLWDITRPQDHLTPAQAREATDGYLGAGYMITPDDAVIQGIVADVVDPDMTTTEAALALFRWMLDNTEYVDERIEATDLLSPRQTIEQQGGVCRDLAALYVSLLRAAGIPARLVSGYLAGEVDGFHAWVEYYGAPAGDPWVPVDVSPMDGRWDDPIAADHLLGPQRVISAFGIHHADYLTLRKIPQSDETEGWSTALSVQYTREAELEFAKDVQAAGVDEHGVLCLNDATFDRAFADSPDGCDPGRFPDRRHVPEFLEFAVRQIDYGVQLESAPRGAEITMEVATPFPTSVSPDRVEYLVYGHDPVTAWEVDAANGLVRADVRV